MARYCSNPNQMVDTPKIRSRLTEKHMTLPDLADAIGVSRHTVMNRLANGDWSVLEAYRVCKVLDLDFTAVFFAHPENAGVA